MTVLITHAHRYQDAGRDVPLSPGEVHDLSPLVARGLIDRGWALPVSHETREVAVAVPAEVKTRRRRS